MKLTETKVKNAKTNEGRQIKLADGGGLYLLVTPTAKLGAGSIASTAKRSRCHLGPILK
jgi:hypothetical protein